MDYYFVTFMSICVSVTLIYTIALFDTFSEHVLRTVNFLSILMTSELCTHFRLRQLRPQRISSEAEEVGALVDTSVRDDASSFGRVMAVCDDVQST